jgi:3-phosphoshikimate 1-carboxyvinyltransferase
MAAHDGAKQVIEPLRTPPRGVVVRPPGSKSITNRALLIAALADGESRLHGALFSDDTERMSEALRALGVPVEAFPDEHRFRVQGSGGVFTADEAVLFAGNAGTAARFLVAAACLGNGTFVVDGNERMRQRPIADLVDALAQLGVTLEAPSGCPPVRISAHGLPGGTTRVRGGRSSQYLSALLQVAPYAAGDVEIVVEDDLVAKPYIDMTLGVMEQFGVGVEREGYARFRVACGQRYRAVADYEIEPDASSAHYFLAAAAITGGRVGVDGIGTASLQGDAHFVDVLERMGATVERGPRSLAVTGGRFGGIDVDMGDISDTALTLAVIGVLASAPVRIRNVKHLRIQESERIAVVTTELRKLGGDVTEFDDGWEVRPSQLHGGEVDTYDDHRIAMAFALLGLRVPGIVIRDPGCVRKTFPNYFDELARLQQGA